MKTMMELLISLQRAEYSLQLTRRGRQFSPLEKQFAQRHLDLVREIIPAEVLALNDRMKTADSDLLSNSPELFAMSVLVATYSSLTASKRKKFVNHFAKPAPRSVVRQRAQCQAARSRGKAFGESHSSATDGTQLTRP
jgi:hypothetical protein